MDDILKGFGAFVLIMVIAVGICFLAAYPTLWLVNYLITPTVLTAVFGIPALTFWKAFWLNFLCSALFKSTSTSNSK